MTARQLSVWSAILAVAAIVGSYGLACVLPFAALAAVAALTLDGRRGLALVGGVWLANQVVGFTLLSYPHDGQAYAWGAIILASACAAYSAARAVAGSGWARMLGAFAAAVLTYQIGMFAGAVLLDGFASSTPEIVAAVVANDAIWFAGLMILWAALGRTALRRAVPANA